MIVQLCLDLSVFDERRQCEYSPTTLGGDVDRGRWNALRILPKSGQQPVRDSRLNNYVQCTIIIHTVIFCTWRESKVYLNCDQGVGVEKTVTIADGEIEGRLHYVR